MSTFQGERYSIALTQPQSENEEKPMFVNNIIDADENSYLTAIQMMVKTMQIDFEDLNRDKLRQIMEAVENNEFDTKNFLLIELLDFGLLASIAIGKTEAIKNILYADYSEAEYYNIYDLQKE